MERAREETAQRKAHRHVNTSMRLLFLVPLLGLTLGPRTIVSNTITSYTVAEVEEDTGATDAGDGDIGMRFFPGESAKLYWPSALKS